ncbi:hypothetical protein [Rubinisphaera italica]|uniref:Uncharacterized protein n=1 Tax=Rubinisphaera italica TaxID=2527969 RepID=A0A5C5XAD4_9PLAN|nr:hypothetical protein [Rubinisphaera italica]TWT59738.1 hypothetical protein Pan54_04480 [Rubinisphaera italica]
MNGNLDVNVPGTWTNIRNHPIFSEEPFSEEWYQGDHSADISNLREICTQIMHINNSCNFLLRILDDCTLFAVVDCKDEFHFEVFPVSAEKNNSFIYINVIQPIEYEGEFNSVNNAVKFLSENVFNR